ncbi:hypothetical protein WJX75_005836 [Coccomyxa subellipsoidea]|uniref:Uncharacterized protein n=1 Tax=Coccomyxa subellipsoidea TaxID=248742 RepID=A0ABR2Z421_9CHLO
MPLLSREATGLPIVIWYSSAKGGHGARIKCSSKLGDVFRENVILYDDPPSEPEEKGVSSDHRGPWQGTQHQRHPEGGSVHHAAQTLPYKDLGGNERWGTRL